MALVYSGSNPQRELNIVAARLHQRNHIWKTTTARKVAPDLVVVQVSDVQTKDQGQMSCTLGIVGTRVLLCTTKI